MAGAVRLSVFLLFLMLAAAAFFGLAGWWAPTAALVLGAAGGIAGEAAFRRLANADERRADLVERVRNPPS